MDVANNFGDQNVIPICILGVVGFDTSGNNVTVTDGDVSQGKRIVIRRKDTNKLAVWTGSTLLEAAQTVSSGDSILLLLLLMQQIQKLVLNGNTATGSTGLQQGYRKIYDHTF